MIGEISLHQLTCKESIIMPTLIVLVGLPGSGKSYYTEHVLSQKFPDAVYASTDIHIEKYAKSVGKTYSEVFDEYMPTAIKLMMDAAHAAKAGDVDVIWDQTSTTVASRKRKLVLFPEYYKIAIEVVAPPAAVHNARLNNRPGKTIPEHVMSSMAKQYVSPTEAEGFDKVLRVNSKD